MIIQTNKREIRLDTNNIPLTNRGCCGKRIIKKNETIIEIKEG